MTTAVHLSEPKASFMAVHGALLQRKCSWRGGSDTDCEECRAKATLQRKVDGSADLESVSPIVHETLRSPGQPLDATTRAFMESRFGHDFSRVRVHTDARAVESARSVNAFAYTVGRDVVFGTGQYTPHSREGRRLLAHELVHVVQQSRGGGFTGPLRIDAPHGAAEQEADQVANAVSRGSTLQRPASSVSAGLQRMVFVKPAAAAGFILGQFNVMCPGNFGVASDGKTSQITADCSTSDRTRNKSCECLCDTAHDRGRQYTITVKRAEASTRQATLHDGTTANVPDTTVFPSTAGDEEDPAIIMAASGSSVEFGAFQTNGRPYWYESWRILAHELCGHGRLKQRGTGDKGCRRAHDVTIATENEIAAEHGGPARGKFNDRRQGEAFLNPVGDRTKVRFSLCNGLHFERP
jgi:hypothetical protein